MADEYAMLSTVGRLTLRWISNEKRYAFIRRSLAERLLEIDYEQLVLDPRATFDRIGAYLRLDHSIALPAIKLGVLGVLEKWRDDLAPEQIAAIDATLGCFGFEAARVQP
jgi:hypothetical protein